jgi:hypothetical protein
MLTETLKSVVVSFTSILAAPHVDLLLTKKETGDANVKQERII